MKAFSKLKLTPDRLRYVLAYENIKFSKVRWGLWLRDWQGRGKKTHILPKWDVGTLRTLKKNVKVGTDLLGFFVDT